VIIIVWALLKSLFTTYGRSRNWKRNVIDAATLWVAGSLNRRQARAIVPSTQESYEAFMKKMKMEPLVEEIGEDARLLWIGHRQTDRVLLYFHGTFERSIVFPCTFLIERLGIGGAFVFSAFTSAPAFWNLIQRELDSRGKRTDAVILNYSEQRISLSSGYFRLYTIALVPDAMFPVQLRQAVLSIQRLFTLGFEPENIQLVGDSAGGTLIHQVFSHILHPVEGVPKLTLTSPLGGAYMMSPWTRLVDGQGSLLHDNEGRGDVMNASVSTYWGSKVLAGAKPSAVPYLEPASAPKDWLQGVDKCVRRVLISAGELEFLRDEIVHYGKRVEEHLKNTMIVVQENGTHDDPLFDILVGEKCLLTPKILDWLEEGFAR
jgi:hypothetical protein